MLEAMKSLLGGSINSSVPQQSQIAPQKSKRQIKHPSIEKTNANPAVELNVSEKAKRIMAAIENGQLKFDDKGQIYRNLPISEISKANDNKQINLNRDYKLGDNILETDSTVEKLNILIKNFLDDIEKDNATQENSDRIIKIDKLFSEIEITFNENSNQNNINSLDKDKQLSLYDKSKAIILFSELNRILGNVGVFFGRDLSLIKMSVSAQGEAFKMIDQLSDILGKDNIDNINDSQAAHIDAIFRQLDQIYKAVENK